MSEKTRPNAAYKLSKTDSSLDRSGEDGELHFYYDREKRLAKAPRAVKDLYIEPKRRRFGLLGSLVSTKSKAFLFITIVLLCVMIIFLSLGGYFETSHSLDGNKLIVKGNVHEGTVILTVRKTINKGTRQNDIYTGAVDIAVSPVVKNIEEEYPVFYSRLFFTQEPEEEYRFAVPFDSDELILVFQTEKSTLSITIRPE
ncbi:MAG: hypothetical protein FWG99_04320 [Treponema sp.]|nr:hypothetical protein [Treponema sp.]